MSRLKKIGFICLLLLIFSTSILWILIKSIKPELIKDYVNTQLTHLTNQPSQVNGDISWQFFPSPGIKLTSIQIGEANTGHYTAKLENARFNLKLMPLLQGKFVFSELEMNGFNIQINADMDVAHGKANATVNSLKAESLQKTTIQKGSTQKETPPKESLQKEQFSPEMVKTTLGVKEPVQKETIRKSLTSAEQAADMDDKFAIERILLSRGQVTFSQGQEKLVLSNLQVGAEKFNFQKMFFPLQFRTGLEIQSEDKKVVKAAINFKGRMALSNMTVTNLLDAFEKMPIKGQVSVEQLRAGSLKVDKMTANVKTKAGALLLTPITLNLYDGESVGDLSYEFASKKLQFNQTATNLNGEKLGFDLTKKEAFKGSIDLSMHTQINFQDTHWKDTMVSRGNLTIKDGRLPLAALETGLVDMVNTLSNAIIERQELANISKKKSKVPPQLPTKQLNDLTAFADEIKCKILTLQYVWKDDKLQSDSFVLQTDKLQVTGAGIINFNNDVLDSHLFATLSADNKEVEKVQTALGGSFPLLVRGTLTNPLILPDVKRIMPSIARMGLEETISMAVESAQHRYRVPPLDNKLIVAVHSLHEHH